jgi:hypothetical protein
MDTFAAFGLGLGNLGKHSRVRITTPALNRGLANARAYGVIIAAYGHTGSFLVQSEKDETAVAAGLSSILKTGCAVLPLTELQAVLDQLRRVYAPGAVPGVRWTPGAAFLVGGTPRAGTLEPAALAIFERARHEVVLVWKRDAVTADWILAVIDVLRAGRAVAANVGRQLGGTWMARSVRTLAGTLRLAVDLDRAQ